MSAQLDALIAQVRVNTELEASVVVLVTEMAAEIQAELAAIAAQGADTQKLQELTDELAMSATILGAAVTANTTQPEAPVSSPVVP